MKIKEIKEMKEVVVRTEYIAVDGTVFNSKESCEEWENSYRGLITRSIKAIPHVETNGEDAYIQCDTCDDEVWCIKPRDFYDVEMINAYVNYINHHYNSESKNCLVTHEDIGKLLILDFGYDHDYCSVFRVDEYLKRIIDTYNKYENEIEEKNKETK